MTHESGSANPTDDRMCQRDPLGPVALGLPAIDHGDQRSLGLAVSTVAAERSAVRRTGQHHVQVRVDVAVVTDLRQTADEALHRPEQHAHFHFGASAGVGEFTADTGSCEREEHRRRHGRLDELLCAACVLGGLVADPVDQRVDVGVRRHVRGNHPEGGTGASILAVQVAVEAQTLTVESRGGHEYRCATGKELARDRCRDGTLAGARHYCDLACPLGCVGFCRSSRISDAGVDLGECGAAFVGCTGGPPLRLCGDGGAGTDEVLDRQRGVTEPNASEILTRTCPAVVEQNGLLRVECRSNQTRPVGAEFSRDQVDQFGVLDRRDCRFFVQSELLEYQACGRGQNAVATGDVLGELTQSGCVDGSAASAAGSRQRDADSASRPDRGNCAVDDCVHCCSVGQCAGAQATEVAAADAGAVTGTESHCCGDVVCPAVAQFPDLLDAVGDVAGTLARGAEDLTQVIVDRIGEHRSERLVRTGELVDGCPQGAHVGVCGPVDGTEGELGAEVDQKLVATRGNAVAQCLDRVRGADLIGTELGPQADQDLRGVGRLEGEVVRTRSTRRCSRRGSGNRSSGRGGRSSLRGRRFDLVVVIDSGVDVGAVDDRSFALDVENLDRVAEAARQLEGLRREVCNGRGSAETDLDEAFDPESTFGLVTEEQVLRLDPTDRAGELPSQQLDQDDAGQLVSARCVAVEVCEDFLQRLGRHQVGDFLNEVTTQRERLRNQVRDVAADQDVRIDVVREQVLQAHAEVRHATAKDGGVERHVDAGNLDVCPLATEFCSATIDFDLECVETGYRTGNGVLAAAQVQVDDFEELTGGLGDTGDEALHVVVGNTDLRRANSGHAVVGASGFVTGNELVHGGATLEDDLEKCFERENLGDSGECVVLTDRVTGQKGILDEGSGFAQLGNLGNTENGHGHLGELSQVQDTVGMPVLDTTGLDGHRVVAHDSENRESERLTSVLVRALPDVAGGLGACASVEAHARALNALAGEGVDGLRCGSAAGGDHDQFAVDAAADLDDFCALVDADTVDADVDLGAGANHPEEAGGPGGQAARRDAGLGRVDCGDYLLRCGGEPHAVHDRGSEAGQQSGVVGGVNRVVVTGNLSEGAHADRSEDLRVTATTTRGVDSRIADRSTGASRVGEFACTGASADRETLGHGDDCGGVEALAEHGTDLDLDLDDATEVGVENRGDLGVDDENACLGRQLTDEVDRVVEVDQVEHAFDNGKTVELGCAEDCEHCRPACSDDDVRNSLAADTERGGQTRTGDTGVIGDAIGNPRDVEASLAVLDCRKFLSGSNCQERGHRTFGIGFGDNRSAAVDDGLGDRDRDVDGLACHQRNRKQHVRGIDDGQTGTGGAVNCLVGRLCTPLVEVAETTDGVLGQAAGPLEVRSRENGVEKSGCGILVATARECNRSGSGSNQFVVGRLLEAIEQVTDRLVDTGDAGDGNGAGDDANLIGGVAGVVCLPQGVAAPPTTHVTVDDGNEVDRLARRLAQRDEERDVCGMQNGGRVVRVRRLQCADRSLGALEGLGVSEQRGDRAAVDRVQTRLGALEHLAEASTPGDVEPRARRRLDDGVLKIGAAVEFLRRVDADGQLEVAAQPLCVRHGLDVAEVRLGGDVEGGDDLVAALGHCLGIAGNLVEEAPGTRSRVVDLVDVGTELATAGGHSAFSGTCTDPVRRTGCVDEELLDLGRGGGLESRHGCGADQDAVDGHGRETGCGRPATGQVIGCALGCSDAATDADDQVRACTQLGVRVEEQVVEVFPRVVSAGAAAFDVDDDREVRNLVGDADHGADLRHGAGLECNVGDADLGQLVDESNSLFEFRDTGGDDDAVDGSTGGTGTLHEALATELQLPQVRVEEQGVELDRAARLEQHLQLCDTVFEDFFGDLPATGKLGPVTGIGCRGNDLGVDRRRRHTCEQDG